MIQKENEEKIFLLERSGWVLRLPGAPGDSERDFKIINFGWL